MFYHISHLVSNHCSFISYRTPFIAIEMVGPVLALSKGFWLILIIIHPYGKIVIFFLSKYLFWNWNQELINTILWNFLLAYGSTWPYFFLMLIRNNICESLRIKDGSLEGCDYWSRRDSLPRRSFLFRCFLS
jgi:hypothetical protein